MTKKFEKKKKKSQIQRLSSQSLCVNSWYIGKFPKCQLNSV